jgi:hypothetical protein
MPRGRDPTHLTGRQEGSGWAPARSGLKMGAWLEYRSAVWGIWGSPSCWLASGGGLAAAAATRAAWLRASNSLTAAWQSSSPLTCFSAKIRETTGGTHCSHIWRRFENPRVVWKSTSPRNLGDFHAPTPGVLHLELHEGCC